MQKIAKSLNKIKGGENLAKITCGICNNEFSKWKDFENHINTVHSSPSITVECPDCKSKLRLEVSPMGYKPGW